MTDPKERRSAKSVFISTGFQGRIVSFIVLAGFLCMASSAYLCYSYVVSSYDFILKYSSLPREIIDDRYRDLYGLWVSLGLVDLLIVLVIATWSLFVTHRAAGSVYHMKRVIDEVRAGNSVERIQLRKKDEFQDLAKSINEMLDVLQKK
jgi:HAMP domain-containing protein